ncbi:MAG: phosphoribosylglycinamide formyltransferase [archaeon]|nr:phosphoribosylglycinamide formyltransferase [archaeon]
MPKLRLAIMGSTRGTDMQAIIDAIKQKKLDATIELVVSDKKDAPILERARRASIETVYADYKKFASRPETEKWVAEQLKKKMVDLVLLIGYMKILSPYFVNEFVHRIWNIHPSLLPKYAGGMDTNVHEQVLNAGEKETGCTLHEVSKEVDTGKIIMQKKVRIEKGENADSLKEKVQKAEQECLLEALKMVIDGKIVIGEQK